jgi:hypothetical protein
VFPYPHRESTEHRIGSKLRDRPDGDVLSLGQYHTASRRDTSHQSSRTSLNAPLPTPHVSLIEVDVRIPEVRVSSVADPRDKKKAEGIRFYRAYPGCPRGEIEGPGGRREVEGSGWKLNEERHEAERKRREGGEGYKSNADSSAARNRRRTTKDERGEGKMSLESTQGVLHQSASCAGENTFMTTDIPS